MPQSSVQRGRQTGMVMVESLLALPVIVLFACLWVQIVWLFWAGQTLAVGSSYALRAGVLHQGERQAIERTLAAAMATIDPTTLANLDFDFSKAPKPADFQKTHVIAAARQQLHVKVAGRIAIRHATPAQFKKFGEQRRIHGEWRWVIPNDHLDARAQTIERSEQQDWLAAQQLEIEVWWCFPLQVPLAAQVLAAWSEWQLSAAQQFCRTRTAMTDTPYWVLTHHIRGPMLSDLVGPPVTDLF
ncbi:hypothetical protein CWE22_04635 [Pseudidiomarina aestuarii]|uniref:Pilus assembly protein TadE n=1 Tax=Pseudidiomarina aestuarii TaxID=624146 RepID=A0A7Z7ETX9_9GAMM|nr:hypothetical protein [Pseudidiomarina aestuarii]RUO41455.1 hypothetical protein CWE22_04635 [Pseudidiomarina aestuarii]